MLAYHAPVTVEHLCRVTLELIWPDPWPNIPVKNILNLKIVMFLRTESNPFF